MNRSVLRSTSAAMLGVAALAAAAAAGPASNVGKVIITEIFANPNDNDGGGFGINSAGDNLEFIEIFNTTNDPIDISGWYLDDEDPTAGVPFPPGTILGPRQALAIIGARLGLTPNDPLNPGQYLPETSIWTTASFNDAWGGTPRNVLIIPGNITIANTPTIFNEVPFLVDNTGAVIDRVTYGAPGFPPVTAGQSIVLRPQYLTAEANDLGCAWQLASADPVSISSSEVVFLFPATGTPITRDRLSDAGNVASPGIVNQVAPAPADCNNNGIPDDLETCGTAATSPDCNGNLIPDACEPDLNNNGIPDTCDTLNNREGNDRNLNNVLDSTDINLAGGTNGIGGSLDTNNNGIIDGAEDWGKVIITEIMVDPFTTGGTEWVEIQNVSSGPVDISGYRLVDIETGGDGYTSPVPAGTILQPGEIAVLCQNAGTLSSAGGVPYTDAELIAVYQQLWGVNNPQGLPIRFIPLSRWGARATNATPTAEILTLVRGAIINDAAVPAATPTTSGPHPTRLASGPTTWVTDRGYIIDVANFSNVNSNGEPLDFWPGSDSHSSFALLPAFKTITGNNPGTSWRLSIGGLNGAYQSADLTGNPAAPFGFGNFGEDFGSPGFVPTTNQSPTGDVIISEIAATTNSIYPGSNPTPVAPQTVAAGRDEWVEIVNTTSAPIDISGWYLQDEDGRTTTFPAGTTLAPNSAAVIIGVDDFAPTDQPGLLPLTGRNFADEFANAWGCGFQVIPVREWYTSTGVLGLARLADNPSFTNEILRLVKADGTVADVVNFDDDNTPTGAASFPFGWPGDAATGVTTFWSIYTLPSFNTQSSNDLGTSWAASLTGFDGGVQSIINAAVDGSGFPTGIYNRGMFGSPGFVQGITAAVNAPGAAACQCAADFDGVNGVDVQDIFAFLNAWFAGNPASDFDGVNGVDVQDIFAFLNAWFAGC